MKFLAEKLSFAVMVNDFLHFSYAYEKSEESFQSYCATEFGVDIEKISLAHDRNTSESICYHAAFELINRDMPFRFCAAQPVVSHFTNDEDHNIPFFTPCELFNGKVNFPDNSWSDCDELVSKAVAVIKRHLLNNCCFETLFIALENYCTYFSVDEGKTSFFEFLKLKAGHASIHLHQLMNKTEEQSLLICSFDFLGIKEFKFAEKLNNDLNLMQMSSLYIDIFRENVLDEFLELVGLTRANVVFSGGRHIHMYLPFFNGIKKVIDIFVKTLNNWCVEHHKTALYVSYGYAKTSVNSLKASCKPQNYYLRLFERIASVKAEVESAKYTPANILTINARNRKYAEMRTQTDFVAQLEKLYRFFCDNDRPAIDITTSGNGIPVFPGKYISLEKVPYSAISRRYLNKVSVCCYDEKDIGIWLMQKTTSTSFDIIAEGTEIGVLRLDIDDFRKQMLSYGQKAEKNIPDSFFKMMLSKEFALFLRYYIYILVDEYKNITIVHEGADDVFIVGKVNVLFDFAFYLSSQYQRYTNNKMTVSGGYTIFKRTTRFLDTANEAQELMNKSKTVEGKNAITVLNSLNTYKWEEADRNEIRTLLDIH